MRRCEGMRVIEWGGYVVEVIGDRSEVWKELGGEMRNGGFR